MSRHDHDRDRDHEAGQESPELEALLRASTPPTDGEADAELGALWGELRQRVDAHDASLRGRARDLPTPARFGLVAGLAVLLVAAVGLLAPRPDLSAYPLGRMLLVVLGLGGLLLVSVRMSLRPLHRPAPRPATVLSVLGLSIATAAGFSLLPAAHVLLPHTAPSPELSLWQHVRPCLVFGFALGLPLFAALRVFDRGTPMGAWPAAAALGLVGNLALQLHCPITQTSHLLLGHAPLGLLAAVLVWLWTRARPRARA
ncbi:MAG: hypothetical protein PVI30_19190 [Myxococcales bacterium]|jgi:hypothetical protein